MLRGVITFSKAQVEEILTYLEKGNKDSMLYIKMRAGVGLNKDIVPVELSEEEIEVVLDEIGIDGDKKLREMLNGELLKWRS